MRELSGDVGAAIAALRGLQVQISSETTFLASMMSRGKDPDRVQQCLQRLRQLGSDVARSSDEITRIDLLLRLESAAISSHFPRRGKDPASPLPIPWTWIQRPPL